MEDTEGEEQMQAVEVGPYFDGLFCLKREWKFSNLTSVEGLRILHNKKGEELKQALIYLYDADGEVSVLELWNQDAVDGVRFLEDQFRVGQKEVLLKFSKLDQSTHLKEKRTCCYKFAPPTQYMREHWSIPVKNRIVASTPVQNQPCDLKAQCTQLQVTKNIQLLCDGIPLRHFSRWHKTVQQEEEDNEPDELQYLIYRAAGLSELGKRKTSDETTKPDKGFIPLPDASNDDIGEKKEKLVKTDNNSNKKSKNSGVN